MQSEKFQRVGTQATSYITAKIGAVVFAESHLQKHENDLPDIIYRRSDIFSRCCPV